MHMKNKIFFMALVAILSFTFSSCSKTELNYPAFYVVNSSNYLADVYCDNHFITTTTAHGNSGKVVMNNVSINLPVLVEVYFYDSKHNYVGKVNWKNYYFKWNKNYKLTIFSSSQAQLQQY